jgi:hypothetical protein
MCVEGAPDFVGTQVPEIMPYLLRLLDDPEFHVRQAALHSTARLADDVPEDFTKAHEKLMPLLFKNMTAAMSAPIRFDDFVVFPRHDDAKHQISDHEGDPTLLASMPLFI